MEIYNGSGTSLSLSFSREGLKSTRAIVSLSLFLCAACVSAFNSVRMYMYTYYFLHWMDDFSWLYVSAFGSLDITASTRVHEILLISLATINQMTQIDCSVAEMGRFNRRWLVFTDTLKMKIVTLFVFFCQVIEKYTLVFWDSFRWINLGPITWYGFQCKFAFYISCFYYSFTFKALNSDCILFFTMNKEN